MNYTGQDNHDMGFLYRSIVLCPQFCYKYIVYKKYFDVWENPSGKKKKEKRATSLQMHQY